MSLTKNRLKKKKYSILEIVDQKVFLNNSSLPPPSYFWEKEKVQSTYVLIQFYDIQLHVIFKLVDEKDAMNNDTLNIYRIFFKHEYYFKESKT